MDRTAIEKIVEIAEPNIVQEHGYIYSDKDLKVIKSPSVRTVELKTLSSLVKLIKLEGGNYKKPIVIKVDTPTFVKVYSGVLLADRTREEPYSVTAEVVNFDFGHWCSYYKAGK